MTDIIHKIIYIDDIFKYIIDFLHFDDKIIFSKVINKNLVINIIYHSLWIFLIK